MNHIACRFVLATILGLSITAPANAGAPPPGDALARDFAQPPDATKPRCYWYWMDGQITKEGITRDLEAMKRVGIGEGYIGVIGGQSGTPTQSTTKALTDEWWSYIEHAIREGMRLGVDIGVFNSPGWSQSGGPWVKPTQAMRYVVLPETRLRGPQHFEGKLPTPVGEFQDIAVLGFPAPAGEDESARLATRTPTTAACELPAPFTARSLTVQPVKALNVTAELQVSDDGQQYRTVKKFTIDRHNLGPGVGPVPLAPIVATFPATTARFFQLKFSGECELGEIRMSPAARVESYAEKSLLKMFQDPLPPFDYYQWPAQAEPDSASLMVRPEAVRDISKQMAADGTLRWDVPSGEWLVLRAAMTPTGTKNSPAPPEATGYEVDKMNRAALKSHFDAYVGNLLQRMPAAERMSLKHVVADSYEQGPENWTDGFAQLFQQRYHYDPMPWLPVLTGRVVGSEDQSDRFLWDLRRLVAELVARDYVGALSDLSRQHGLKMWLEDYGHWGFPSEFLLYGGYSDEVAGEFWASGDLGRVELRDASSAAHIYGKRVVWSEAFTGGPAFINTPRDLKELGDKAFCEGINQFMLHVYIHQPWEDRQPGVNAWFGTEFNRHNTWFEQSRSWIDYLRRSTVMLQAGRHVADVAYFIGEDAPKMTGLRKPELPVGCDFDWINSDVIERRITVSQGRLVLPDGMSYRLLVLPESVTMRPEVLHKLRDLVKAGATVVGTPPLQSPSRQNYPKCDQQVRSLAAELWGAEAVQARTAGGASPQSQHALGKGHVLWGVGLQEALAGIGVGPDFRSAVPLRFTHRTAGDTEIYFITNPKDREVSTMTAFRVRGLAPEFWHPDTGLIERPAVYDEVNGAVQLPVQLGPHGSVFVVFRQKAASSRILTLARDGQVLLDARKALPPVPTVAATESVDTFTLVAWVKPAADTTLLPETNTGVHGMGEPRNDVLFPPHGGSLGGGSHAGSGLAVGRNGIAVFEHGANYFAPVLVQPITLTNWTHVAVVYRAGQPSLYVNGVFAHKGLASGFTIHGLLGGGAPPAPYRGEVAGLDCLPRALDETELAQLVKAAPAPGVARRTVPLDLVTDAGGSLQALAWEPGSYALTTADGRSRTFSVPQIPEPFPLPGPWEVQFTSGRGAPDKVSFDELADWTQRPEEGIKHYSGTAVYRKAFDLPASALTGAGSRLILDLGQVHDLATVRLNGQALGTLWLAPWRLDVTAAARPGRNLLEVEVVNAWHNRLAGDKALPAAERHTFLTADTVSKDAPLLPAGLMGPVSLQTMRVLPLGSGD
jgi:hypothetical protein